MKVRKILEKAKKGINSSLEAIADSAGAFSLMSCAKVSRPAGVAMILAALAGTAYAGPAKSQQTPWEWDGPAAAVSVQKQGVSPQIKQKVDYVLKNEGPLFAAAVDAQPGPSAEFPLALVLLPPPDLDTDQNLRKGVVYQAADMENALGWQHKADSEILAGIQDMWSYSIDAAKPGVSFDESQVSVVRTQDGSKVITDNLYAGDGSGVTGVRPGHLIWPPGKTLFVPAELVDLIDINYLRAEVEGKVPVPSGRCDAGFYVIGFDDKGRILCEQLPSGTLTGVPSALPGDTSEGHTDVLPGDTSKEHAGSGTLPGDTAEIPPSGRNHDRSRIHLNGIKALDVNASFGITDYTSSVETETPDINGVPIKSKDTAHSTNMDAKVLAVYNINDTLGVAGGTGFDASNGQQNVSEFSGEVGVTLSPGNAGQFLLAYVIGKEDASMSDGPVDVSRKTSFQGLDARFASSDLWKDDKKQAFITVGYRGLSGDSEGEVSFNDPLLSSQKTSGGFSKSEIDGNASVLFLPTKVGVFGLEGTVKKTSTDVEDGKYDNTQFGVGVGFTRPVEVFGTNATVDASLMYMMGEEDPHSDSVSKAQGSGTYLRIGIRPADKGRLY